MVWHQISRTSALDLTFGKIGTLIRERVLCARCRGCVFCVEISRIGWFESISSRDLMDEIMDLIDDVERFKDIYVYIFVYGWFGTKSLEI